MATGSLDANGIWIYGEDDSETTFSGLLNKLGDSTSDKVGTMSTNITNLENKRWRAFQASSMNVNPIPVAPLTVPNSTQTITVPGSGYTTIILYGSGMQMNIAMSVALRLWVNGSNVNTIESSVQNGFFRYGNHSSYAANLPAGNHTINLSVEASSSGVSVCYNAYWTAFVVKN
jgi:hypothetical protein